MTIEKDGGPAFPMLDAVSIHNHAAGASEGITDEHESTYNMERIRAASGMTLRDYFAAKAMQGSIARTGLPSTQSYRRNAAQYAYLLADAMLKQRDSPQE